MGGPARQSVCPSLSADLCMSGYTHVLLAICMFEILDMQHSLVHGECFPVPWLFWGQVSACLRGSGLHKGWRCSYTWQGWQVELGSSRGTHEDQSSIGVAASLCFDLC